jgi:AAA domain
VREYGRDYWRAQVALRGETTPDGHRRVQVIYIALTGNTHIRGLNAAICRFYGLPERGDADTLAERAKDAVLSLKTSVFLVDDVHFLAPGHANANSVKMANHLKFLANTFPVTLVYVGVGVAGTGLLTEGRAPQQALQAQFGRRTTVLTMRPFQVYDEPGREEWRRLPLSVERQLVLAGRYPGCWPMTWRKSVVHPRSADLPICMARLECQCVGVKWPTVTRPSDPTADQALPTASGSRSGAVRRRAHQPGVLALRARTSWYCGLPSSRRPRAVRGTVVTVNPDAVRSLRTACSVQVR